MNKTISTSLLDRAYDSKDFKQVGHDLIEVLSEHLGSCQSGDQRTLEFIEPEQEISFWNNYDVEDPIQFFKDVVSRSIHVHHRKYIGHQVAPPLPLAALAGLVSELLNDGMGIYEMGSAATAIERIVIAQFAECIGYEKQEADGFLTSGGTLANLTALLGARNRYYENHHSPPLILVSEQAHFCIERAAMTMGFQTQQVVKIPTDDNFCIDIKLLEDHIKKFHAEGRNIMAIVGCSCTTSTGSYDDLMAIGRLCKNHNIWMHVDGAHGGAAVFSKEYKSLCKGIEFADSVIIDAHKMMMCPALATAVVFKRGKDSYKALAIDAAYLFHEQEGDWYNLAKRTYETTKFMMSIKIFLIMNYYGLELIDQYVSRQYSLARQFAQFVQKRKHFAIGHDPMSNIVCFRYINNTSRELNQLNAEIRKQLLLDGEFYIVQTNLNGKIYLRITIMSPYTTVDELHQLLDKIEEIAKDSGNSELT